MSALNPKRWFIFNGVGAKMLQHEKVQKQLLAGMSSRDKDWRKQLCAEIQRHLAHEFYITVLQLLMGKLWQREEVFLPGVTYWDLLFIPDVIKAMAANHFWAETKQHEAAVEVYPGEWFHFSPDILPKLRQVTD